MSTKIETLVAHSYQEATCELVVHLLMFAAAWSCLLITGHPIAAWAALAATFVMVAGVLQFRNMRRIHLAIKAYNEGGTCDDAEPIS